MPDNINQLWTVTDVANSLNLGQSTIWRKVKEGEFPSPIKIGGSTRWSRAEIEQYIARIVCDQRCGAHQVDPSNPPSDLLPDSDQHNTKSGGVS